MDIKSTLTQLCGPALKDLGFTLVYLQLSGTQRLKLSIIIEKIDYTPISMDDCVKASRELSALLDAEDPINSAYVLEVSSPGEDRPLVNPDDFIRFINHTIKFETNLIIEGSKRFQGLLITADHRAFTVQTADQKIIVIEYNQLLKARLNPIPLNLPSKKRRT